jgi:hypothetical protein
MKTKYRQARRSAQKKERNQRNFLLYGGSGLVIIVVVIVVLLLVNRPPSPGGLMGEEIAISSATHISNDAVPGPYNSNPPAGGPHYETTLPTRFYQESDLAGLAKNPQGHLVHNLEHGYVIFWYNCQAVNTDCAALKQTIQTVMNETGGTKLIAFPWSDMNVPLTMTSWGRLLRFATPDAAVMKQFVERNRYQSPEPDGP